MLSYGVEIICGDAAVAFSLLICPLVLYLALAEGPCVTVLRLKPFVQLGNISLSVFFWHLPLYYVFELAQEMLLPGSGIYEMQYLLYGIALLAWSIFSHCVIEKKLLPANQTKTTILS